MKKKPLLSIITATYNSDKTLESTILSLLNQEFLDFEYIIIDGNSQDNTITIIKKYKLMFDQKGIAYKWISEPDTGIYNAWNKGLKLADGKWISFLGSDDYYLDNTLISYVNCIQNNPNVDFIHSKVHLIDNKNNIIYNFINKWSWDSFKREMRIAHVGAFHNNNYFNKYGYYNESYKIAGDYELLLRAKNKLRVVFVDVFTASMKDGGISNNMVLNAFKEARQAKITSGGIPKLYAYYLFYLSIIKYNLSKIRRKFLPNI